GPQLAILRELAAWREGVAQAADLPPRALLRDEVLVDLARRPPRDAQRLAQVRHMPRPLAERYSQQMLDAIERGRSAQPLPTSARAPEPSLTEKFAADAAFSLL